MNSVLKYLLGEHLKAVVETAAEKRSLILDLSHHDISDVPDDIASCRLLEHLYLHCNRFTQFPNRIIQLRHLTTLTLDYNNLTSIPPEIASLKQLANLNISHNPLGTICNEICTLERLEGLWCNNTDIEELPTQIGDLTQLDVLGARSNRIRTIPDEICKLNKLRWLTLENNQIERLPANIGEMSSLIHLNVRRNCITDIPSSIVNCKKLAYFRLNDNALTKLPDEFIAAMSSMPRLKAVDLHEEVPLESEEEETAVHIHDDTNPAEPSSEQTPREDGARIAPAELLTTEEPNIARRLPLPHETEEGESEASDEDWDNSVASYELDMDYQSDDDLQNRPDVEPHGEDWEMSVASLDLNLPQQDGDPPLNFNLQELGMALPFLSKYTSLAS